MSDTAAMKPRQKKRQRLTLVCEFCRRRKVKCDKGNPCGTCVKYGNKYCHYADHLSLFDQYDVRPELSSVNHAKGEGDNSAFGLSTNGPSGDSKSELERELELLKEKIKSIEESVTSISGEVPSSLVNGGSVRSGSSLNFLDLATVTHNSNSIHGIGGGNGNSNGGGSGSGSGSGNSGSYTSPTMVSGAAATISGSTGTGTGSVNASPVASPVVTPKNKFSTLLGRNPVASNYDTINFYAGYTPIQDKEPLRRANFGPLSWVALLRKDQGLSLLWDYIQTRRSVMELKMKVFGDEAATTKSENHFQEILKESFGFNDVRLYKNPGVDIDGKPQSVEGNIPGLASPLISDDMLYNNSGVGTNINSQGVPGQPGPFGEGVGVGIVGNMGKDSKKRNKFKSEVPESSPTNNNPSLFPSKRSLSSDRIAKSKINARARSLGISFYTGDIDHELELAEKIELILPNESVIWLLIDRFFTHLYPFLPIVDEHYFKEGISLIIGPEGYDNKKKVKIQVQKKLDFATLGLLLLMLRLSYLSLLTTVESVNERNINSLDQSPQAQRLKYLLNNPINLDVVDCAQSCLNQFNLLRRANMSVMQLALFTRLYHMYAPEDGDGSDGGDSQVLTATLVQMALSLGLNREPDQFPDACNDEKTNNIGRKIWYLLLILDMTNAMQLGTPMSIHKSMFDTKFPFYKKGNENIADVEFEKKILSQTFPRVERTYEPLSDIINMVLDIRANVNMAQLAEKLNFLETYFIQEYGRLRTYFNENDGNDTEHPFIKTLKMKIYFHTNFFLVSLFFHFFCFYEKKKNSEYAFYYLKKIFVITISDLMPYYIELLDKNPNVFKDLTDLIITPGFELVLHKSFIVCNAILIRIKMILHTMRNSLHNDQEMDDNSAAYFTRLTKMDQLIQRCNKIFLETVGTLSKRYYYSWRILKAGCFVFDLIRNKDFYEAILENDGVDENGLSLKLLDMRFSNEMLDDLIELFEDSLARVPKKKKKSTTPTQTNHLAQTSMKSNKQMPHLAGVSDSAFPGTGFPGTALPGTGFPGTALPGTTLPSTTLPGNGLNSTIDTKSPVGLDRSDSAVSARDHNTVGSTGSSSFTSENNHADQIDDIWLQMLSIKRGAELNNNANQNFMAPTSNFSNKNENAFEYFAQTPQEQFRFQAETPFGQSGTTATGGSGGNNYGQAETPLTAIRNSEFDVFQGLSFEDIFQG